MATPPNLISVRSDVAGSLLIDGLLEQAVARLDDELPYATTRALAGATDQRLARLGYWARRVELERFPIARGPVPWLVDRVVAAPEATIAELAAALAAEEPLEKPAPADGAPTWRIPGPGGHVRHFLALRAGAAEVPERKRDWVFGFFVACCEDASDQPGSTYR